MLRAAFRLVWRGSGRELRVSIALDVLSAAAGAAIIALAGRILGQLAAGEPFGRIVPSLVWVGLISLTSAAAAVIRAEISALAIEKVAADAVARVLTASTSVPYRLFDSTDFYDRLRRAYESAQNQAWSMVQATINIARVLADVLALLVVLLWISPELIVIAAIAFVPLWIVSYFNSRAMYRFSWELTEADRKRSYIEQVLTDRSAAKEARVFRLDRTLGEQHRTIWLDRVRRLTILIRRRVAVSVTGNALTVAVMTVALGLVAWLTARGDLSISDAGVGVLAVRRLSAAVAAGSVAVDTLNAGRLYLEDYQTFIASTEDYVDNAGQPDRTHHTVPSTVHTIRLDGVSFAYDENARPAVDDVTLDIRAGELTAIVGTNGSGKTTLLHLLARLYEPDDGVIRWDGVDVAEFDSLEFHQRISALFQDFAKYELLARENVEIASVGPPEPLRVADAVHKAGAHRLVERLPNKLDSPLGRAFDHGVDLSVGEWQRLALARALYRDSALLLLDEPAASLDSIAELEIVQLMHDMARDRAVVYISHRFASVSRADRIVVMADGAVIEDGAHADLLAAGGVYAAMFNAQATAFLSPELDTP